MITVTPPDVFLEGGWLLDGVLLTRREEGGPLPFAATKFVRNEV
jgi:hypothetical protein